MKKVILSSLFFVFTITHVFAQDADKDGVKDKDDACPLSKGTKANNGCPEEQKAKEKISANASINDFIGTFTTYLFTDDETGIAFTDANFDKKLIEIVSQNIKQSEDKVSTKDSLFMLKTTGAYMKECLLRQFTFKKDLTFEMVFTNLGKKETIKGTFEYKANNNCILLKFVGAETDAEDDYNLFFDKKNNVLHSSKEEKFLATYVEFKKIR